MLLSGSLLGSLFAGAGSTQTQQNTQTNLNTKTATEEPVANTVTETADVADSGGTRFDFSTTVSTAVGTAASTTGNTVGSAVSAAAAGNATGSRASDTGAAQSQDGDDNSLNAYFYAAKWARSLQAEVAEEGSAEADAGKPASFATEPYRHDVMAQYFTEQTVHFGGKKLATIGANGVLTLADSSQTVNNPYQARKSLGSF